MVLTNYAGKRPRISLTGQSVFWHSVSSDTPWLSKGKQYQRHTGFCPAQTPATPITRNERAHNRVGHAIRLLDAIHRWYAPHYKDMEKFARSHRNRHTQERTLLFHLACLQTYAPWSWSRRPEVTRALPPRAILWEPAPKFPRTRQMLRVSFGKQGQSPWYCLDGPQWIWSTVLPRTQPMHLLSCDGAVRSPTFTLKKLNCPNSPSHISRHFLSQSTDQLIGQ